MTTLPARSRIDHVGLNVRDLDAMSDWYMAAFGYEVQLRFALDPIGLRIVMLADDDGRRFELLARSAGRAGLRARTPVEAAGVWGYGHVAFQVDGLTATFQRLVASGASPVAEPQPSPEDGRWFAWVHDPEGNLIELIGSIPS